MRIFSTGRLYIGDEISKFFGEAVRILVDPTQNDIKSCLERKLDSDTDPKAMGDNLLADIMRAIPEKASKI